MRIQRGYQRDAQAHFDQILRGPIIVRAMADVRLETGPSGQLHQIRAARGAARDPMLARGHGQRHRFPGLLELFGDGAGAANQQAQRIMAQRVEGQIITDLQKIRDTAVAEHCGGIGLALGNQADRFRRLHLGQAQFDIREHAELDHGACGDCGTDGGWCHQVQVCETMLPVVLDLAGRTLQPVRDGLAMAGKHGAGGGKLHAMRSALHQGRTTLRFQLLDLLADGRLRPARGLGGGGERTVLFDLPQRDQ